MQSSFSGLLCCGVLVAFGSGFCGFSSLHNMISLSHKVYSKDKFGVTKKIFLAVPT